MSPTRTKRILAAMIVSRCAVGILQALERRAPRPIRGGPAMAPAKLRAD